VIEGVEAIMERPYGCGEQTISSTYPSLLLVRRYKQMGASADSNDHIRVRASRYLQSGYERLLNYRSESGGFTYWGRGEPDLALTAYAVRFLIDARELIAVDSSVINGARDWLLKQQQADGSWKATEYGDSLDSRRRTALLTAYVARVLAMTEHDGAGSAAAKKQNATPAADFSSVLKRAFEYLGQRTKEMTNLICLLRTHWQRSMLVTRRVLRR